MNTIQEMYIHSCDTAKKKKELSVKIAIRGDTVVMLTYTKHAPIISLGVEEEDNWCLVSFLLMRRWPFQSARQEACAS